MTTLLDVLHEADAIEIDDHFIRYFYLDVDNAEYPDDTILEVSTTDEDGNMWEWSFTVEELETAEYIPETNEWAVKQAGDPEPYMITAYRIETMGKE